jgi:hypothetical protein
MMIIVAVKTFIRKIYKLQNNFRRMIVFIMEKDIYKLIIDFDEKKITYTTPGNKYDTN